MYELVLPQFAEICAKRYLDEITGDDLLRFIVYLRQKGLADRTIANRVETVSAFLKANGITGLLAPHERPRVTVASGQRTRKSAPYRYPTRS